MDARAGVEALQAHEFAETHGLDLDPRIERNSSRIDASQDTVGSVQDHRFRPAEPHATRPPLPSLPPP